jgi:gamma-glutamyltranspeptidase/glutathione hydrolase
MRSSRFLTSCVLASLWLSSAVAQQPSPTPAASPTPRPDTLRPEIVGTRGIVAAGRHYSVSAGTRILQQGGNAVDAGVASVLAASIVEISHFGFGGESPLAIHEARTGRTVVINGQGPAPRAATPELFAAKGKVDSNGPLGATVPAMLDAMAIALAEFGTLRFEQVMAPALELADGFPMYEYRRTQMIRERKNSEPYPDTMRVYYRDGRVPEVGELFRQPELARTLRAILAAEKAAWLKAKNRRAAIQAARDAFYKGELARNIAAATKAAGGVMSYEDLASYKGRIEEPVRGTFHGFELVKAGPWNQGPVLVQTLNLLEGFDLKAMGHNSAEYIHTVHEALKLAYADRNAYYGDPDFVKVPLAGLLSKPYAAKRRGLITREASLEHRIGDPFEFDPTLPAPAARYIPHSQGKRAGESGDTTCVDVVDRDGNLFSATPSSGWLLGGAFIAGDTGVPMSNRMQVFDLDPLSPNVLVGGKRPRTTLTPTLVLKNGKPFLAISTPGGDSQDQQVLNVLLGMMVFDLEIQRAIEAPRINSLHPHASFDNHESLPGVLEIESRVDEAVRKELEARGHKLRVLGPYGMSTGVVAVGVNPATGTLRGGADVRRERYVFGW